MQERVGRQQVEDLWLILAFLAGTITGSFLNVCIHRMPHGNSVSYPPSHCPTCRHGLRFFDLIPVFSYMALKGRCRHCGVKISLQYPAVELASGILFALSVLKYGITMDALRTILLFTVLVPATVIDLKHRIIPDRLNMAGFFLGAPLIIESWDVFISGAIGFIAGGALLLLIALIYRDGMGGGDIKLAAVMGLLLGWKLLLVALFLAFVLGGAAGLIMVALKMASMKEHVPFGPCLAFGAVASALAGDSVVNWYTGFFSV